MGLVATTTYIAIQEGASAPVIFSNALHEGDEVRHAHWLDENPSFGKLIAHAAALADAADGWYPE